MIKIISQRKQIALKACPLKPKDLILKISSKLYNFVVVPLLHNLSKLEALIPQPLSHITICFIPPSTISNLIASDLLSKLLSINFFIISVTEGIDIFEYIYDIVSSSNFF